MSGRFIAAVSGLTLLVSPAAAANAALDAALALCEANHAEAGAVFAAAEAMGWTMPTCALPRTNDARLGSPTETLDMTPCNLTRIKTDGISKLTLRVVEQQADWPGGPFRIRSCAVDDASSGSADLEAAVTAVLGLPAQSIGAPMTAWIWTGAAPDRAFLASEPDEEMLTAAALKGLRGLQIDRTAPNARVTYSEIAPASAEAP